MSLPRPFAETLTTPTVRLRLWVGILAVGGPLLAIWLAVPSARDAISALLAPLPTIGIAAGLLLFRRPRSRAWLVMAVGSALIAAAAGGYSIAAVRHIYIPSPSFLDALLLVGLPIHLAGLIGIAGGRLRLGRWDVVDAAVPVAAFMLATWFLIFEPAIVHGKSAAGSLVILAAYLLANVVELVIAFFLLTSRGHRQPSFWFLLLAIGAVCASQIAFSITLVQGTYRPGELSDLGWAAAGVFWALAATHPSVALFGERPVPARTLGVPGIRLAVMAVATIVAPASLLVAGLPDDRFDLANIGLSVAAMFALVVLRLTFAVRALGRSVNAQEELEVELREQALRDPLTGLGNRTMFNRELEAAISSDPGGVAVLFCDLDDFKNVNDSLGHEAGDALLVALGARLVGSIRPRDIAARLGGDEFGILLRGIAEPADAVRAAERILAATGDPVEVMGHVVHAGPSIGIAFASAGIDATNVLRDADIAMYLAKSQGKGRYELFRPSLHADVVNRIAVRASLQRALEAAEFVVHYQPIVDLASEQVVAVEALVRWQHPERGLIQPIEFIPIAEATGLIVPLGRFVLDTACHQLADWVRRGIVAHEFSMTVNLSPAQLRHSDVLSHVRGALATSGIAPSTLVLEVTEGIMVDLDAARATLDAIREMGVHVAIDDFGTGYSSLSYLNRLPIDHIKIDRSFVAALGTSERETALTESIVMMAGTLRLDTIAEGIETREQLAALLAFGCRYGQGFLFSRPVPPALIEAMTMRRRGAGLRGSAGQVAPGPVGRRRAPTSTPEPAPAPA